MAPRRGPLAGKKVLIAEDDYLQATDLSTIVTMADGIVHCVPAGKKVLEALAREKFDGVLLDIGLTDGSSANVARQLEQARVPFIIVTGYDAVALPPELRTAPYLAKPYTRDELINLVIRHFRGAP